MSERCYIHSGMFEMEYKHRNVRDGIYIAKWVRQNIHRKGLEMVYIRRWERWDIYSDELQMAYIERYFRYGIYTAMGGYFRYV